MISSSKCEQLLEADKCLEEIANGQLPYGVSLFLLAFKQSYGFFIQLEIQLISLCKTSIRLTHFVL